jgi:hypothetical protein
MTERVTKLGACSQCGGAVVQPATGRPRRHCSAACKQRAYRRRKARKLRGLHLTAELRAELKRSVSAARLAEVERQREIEREIDRHLFDEVAA